MSPPGGIAKRFLPNRSADDIVALDVLPAASLPRVLRLASQEGGEAALLQEPVTVLLDSAPSLLIGATGEGKTTSLRALERHAAERGDVPVLIVAGGPSARDVAAPDPRPGRDDTRYAARRRGS